MTATAADYWYDHRDELTAGMVFNSCFGIVKLDRSVPGDATQWYVQSWYAGRPDVPGYERGHWSCDDSTIEPGDLTDRLPDDYAGPVCPQHPIPDYCPLCGGDSAAANPAACPMQPA